MDCVEVIASVKLLMYQALIPDPVIREMITILRDNGCPAKAIVAWFDHLVSKQGSEQRDE